MYSIFSVPRKSLTFVLFHFREAVLTRQTNAKTCLACKDEEYGYPSRSNPKLYFQNMSYMSALKSNHQTRLWTSLKLKSPGDNNPESLSLMLFLERVSGNLWHAHSSNIQSKNSNDNCIAIGYPFSREKQFLKVKPLGKGLLSRN